MGLSTSRTVCALVFLASVVISPTVLAHAHLKQQSPAADSVVSAPQSLTLNFSEGIEPGFSGVVVTDGRRQMGQGANTGQELRATFAMGVGKSPIDIQHKLFVHVGGRNSAVVQESCGDHIVMGPLAIGPFGAQAIGNVGYALAMVKIRDAHQVDGARQCPQ